MKNLTFYLHRFIHLLSKVQKRNFVRYLTSNKSHYLELFHFLDKQLVYDAQALKVFLKKNNLEANISKTVTYLFDKLSDEYNYVYTSTGVIDTAGEWTKKMDKDLKKAKTLYKLGAMKKAMRAFAILKKKAKKYDHLMFLMKIIQEESIFHNYTNFQFISYDENTALNTAHIETIKKYEYLIRHEQLYNKLTHYISTNNLKAVQKTIRHLDQIENKTYDSYYSRIMYYMSKSCYYTHIGDSISSKQIFKDYHQLLDEHVTHIKEDYHFYFARKSSIAVQQMHLASEGVAAPKAIIEHFKKIWDDTSLSAQNNFTQKRLRSQYNANLIQLQLMAVYKDTSRLSPAYVKEIESRLVADKKQMLKKGKGTYFLANLLNLTFFKIVLKEEESVMDYIAFFNTQDIPKSSLRIFEMNSAMVTLIYYYSFLDRRIFEVQFANFKRRKAVKSGAGTDLMVAFLNAIKRDKYQRNRKNALKYYDLFRNFEKTHQTYIEVSLWLRHAFLNPTSGGEKLS